MEMHYSLTPKESEVLKHLTYGKSRKQIAHDLQISTGTLDTHFRRIFIKINSRSMLEACIWAMKNGFS